MVRLGDLIGKRFVNGGRDVRRGMDCWGLVMEVFKRYGITIPDFIVGAFSYEEINKLTEENAVLHTWKSIFTPKDTDAPLVVLMRMHPKFITHAGVFLGNNKIIHTTAGTGVITSRADALERRIVGYYKYVTSN